MSDRREKVARALYELTSMSQVARIVWGDVQGTVRDLFLREADAALAAMDAEPTEGWAAIEAGSIERAEWESGQRHNAEPTDPNDAHAALGLPKGVTLEPLDDDDPTEAEIEAALNVYTSMNYIAYPERAMRAALIAARKARS